MTAQGPELRALREQITATMFAQLRSASDFADVCDRSQRFVAAMAASGYQLRLLDEDGESMISHGVALVDGRSITTQAFWDEDEGPSAACAFHDEGAHLVLAQSRASGLVEVERNR